MRTISVNVLTFDELDESAKERARQWWRESGIYDEWWDSVYDDAISAAEILGIHINTVTQNGRKKPAIWFSGFASQGDGACFEGEYTYRRGAAKKIREYAPKDEHLHQMADDLQATQRPFFYRIKAISKHAGRYYHSGTMHISVDLSDGYGFVDGSAEHSIAWALRCFADWIYCQLEKEYEYLTSDESVDEMLRVNAYEFHADGSLA